MSPPRQIIWPPFSKTDMQTDGLDAIQGYARMSGFMSPTPLALILFVQAPAHRKCPHQPHLVDYSPASFNWSFHPSILFIHQPVFPCQTLGLRQGIDKKRSMGQSLTSECLCNRALFSWNQMILLFSLWFPSGCTHLCFCLVPRGPLARNVLAALLWAAPVRGSLQAPSPLPTSPALPPLLPTPSAWRPTLSWAVSSLCQSVSSCFYAGARINVPQGHGLLLPCCFMTVSTQTLRLSAHLCICLDSSQQVFKLRKSDGCSQCDHLLSPLVNRSLNVREADLCTYLLCIKQAFFVLCGLWLKSAQQASFSGGRKRSMKR